MKNRGRLVLTSCLARVAPFPPPASPAAASAAAAAPTPAPGSSGSRPPSCCGCWVCSPPCCNGGGGGVEPARGGWLACWSAGEGGGGTTTLGRGPTPQLQLIHSPQHGHRSASRCPPPPTPPPKKCFSNAKHRFCAFGVFLIRMEGLPNPKYVGSAVQQNVAKGKTAAA